MQHKKIQVWIPLLVGCAAALGLLAGYQLKDENRWRYFNSQDKNGNSVMQALELVKYKYVDSIPMDSLEDAGIEAIMARLDPHSQYISPQYVNEANNYITGAFSGIGVEYLMVDDTLTVIHVVKDGPSEKAGLLAGDKIIKLDTFMLNKPGIQGEKLRAMLRGKQGSKVVLTLLRNGKAKTVDVLRGPVQLPSVDASYMAEPGIGYIRLNKFSSNTYREFMDAATALQKQGMTKMILDLRGNGGGLLEQATHIADELLPDDKDIVSMRGTNIKNKTVKSTKPGIFEDGPVVVLMDELSASASEVLAGALQDHDRATIIGRRSFGKGLVQEQFDLQNGGAIRLTVSRYYTPLGRSIQRPYELGHRRRYFDHTAMRYLPDSVKIDSSTFKVFTTKKGKKLFEAGGIAPDIAVPYDSSKLSADLVMVIRRQRADNYAYKLYVKEKARLQSFKSAEDFARSYQFPANTWDLLQQIGRADSVHTANMDAQSRRFFEEELKALIAGYHWDDASYFKVKNLTDPGFLQGLEFIRKQ